MYHVFGCLSASKPRSSSFLDFFLLLCSLGGDYTGFSADRWLSLCKTTTFSSLKPDCLTSVGFTSGRSNKQNRIGSLNDPVHRDNICLVESSLLVIIINNINHNKGGTWLNGEHCRLTERSPGFSCWVIQFGTFWVRLTSSPHCPCGFPLSISISPYSPITSSQVKWRCSNCPV